MAGASPARRQDQPPSIAPVRLVDILSPDDLQEIQDGFTSLTRLETLILDGNGRAITQPTELDRLHEGDKALDWLIEGDEEMPDGDQPLAAPIVVEGAVIGSIVIQRHRSSQPLVATPMQKALLGSRLKSLNLNDAELDEVYAAALECAGFNRAAGVQFLNILANHLARLCYQEFQLSQRVDELSALYRLSTVLAAHRDVQQVLDTAARSAAEVLGVKAASVRLLNPDNQELVIRAGYNLSSTYLDKGPLRLQGNDLFAAALRGQIVYVADMRTDPRVVYPDDARREGIVSAIIAGMIYQNQPIGVLQLFTETRRTFSRFEINLLRAMAQLLAAAIENARLEEMRQESRDVQRQLKLAADVQYRMLPARSPELPNFEIAARYVPCFELGGDFYDLIELQGHVGIAVGDVVGKGIAASLLMAGVRSSLRAFAENLYDLNEIIRRVNVALCHDTLDNEFATLFYGVIDPQRRRLTYCSAGHEPAILLRDGQVRLLDVGGMIVGIDPRQVYHRDLLDMRPGDLLVIHTDGLTDALSFEGKRFGRDRIISAIKAMADKPARDVLNHVLWEMRRYVGLNQSTDDTTIVVVRCRD
ncbi:MAG: SpoIIE family protein phosphatase [Phycisphaeraceae bacterium]|nr:SpoIIE family protein phosphatase [Phycisphaeraceae bacterium]